MFLVFLCCLFIGCWASFDDCIHSIGGPGFRTPDGRRCIQKMEGSSNISYQNAMQLCQDMDGMLVHFYSSRDKEAFFNWLESTQEARTNKRSWLGAKMVGSEYLTNPAHRAWMTDWTTPLDGLTMQELWNGFSLSLNPEKSSCALFGTCQSGCVIPAATDTYKSFGQSVLCTRTPTAKPPSFQIYCQFFGKSFPPVAVKFRKHRQSRLVVPLVRPELVAGNLVECGRKCKALAYCQGFNVRREPGTLSCQLLGKAWIDSGLQLDPDDNYDYYELEF